MTLIANARMYAVAPAVRAAWKDLFTWVAKASGVPLTYVDHAAPAPLEELWAREDLGMAFMCGFPFASADPAPRLIAAPVPAPPRYRGLPQYCTDFVVRTDCQFTRLNDISRGRIGWTVEHSQSGYNAIRHHLLQARREPREPLVLDWVGPLVSPRRVIEAVLDGTIDIGPLDSYVHDLLKRYDPETASRLRTIESTMMTPIPPLIASSTVSDAVVERLRGALLGDEIKTELSATLAALLVTRFVLVNPAGYQDLLAQARNADHAGTAKPAEIL